MSLPAHRHGLHVLQYLRQASQWDGPLPRCALDTETLSCQQPEENHQGAARAGSLPRADNKQGIADAFVCVIACASVLPAGGKSTAAVRPAPGIWAGCVGLLRHKRARGAHVGADAVRQEQRDLLGACHRSVCRVSGVCLPQD